MITNDVYFITIAILGAELNKILIYANWTGEVTVWTQSDEKSQKIECLCKY